MRIDEIVVRRIYSSRDILTFTLRFDAFLCTFKGYEKCGKKGLRGVSLYSILQLTYTIFPPMRASIINRATYD